MKKILFAVLLSSVTLSFAKTNKSSLEFRNFVYKQNYGNGVTIYKNSNFQDIQKQILSISKFKYSFPVTFCDDSGCNTYTFNGGATEYAILWYVIFEWLKD